MEKTKALTTLYFNHEEIIEDIYDDNAEVRSALLFLFPSFEYPDFAHLTVSQALLRYFNAHRFQIPLGKVVATVEAGTYIKDNEIDPSQWLHRHAAQDWGDLDEHDKVMNFMAIHIRFSGRLLSSYNIGDHHKIWVMTYFETEESERNTMLLFPDDY